MARKSAATNATKAGRARSTSYSKIVTKTKGRRDDDDSSDVGKLAAKEAVARDDEFSGPAPLLASDDYFYPFLENDENEYECEYAQSESEKSEISDNVTYGDNGYFSSDDEIFASAEPKTLKHFTTRRQNKTADILPIPSKLYNYLLREEEYVNE